MGWIGATPLRTDHLLLHIEHFGNQTNEDILDRIVCKRVEKIAELQDSLTRFLDTINLQLVIVENIDAILHDTVYHKEMGRSMQSDVVERIRKLTKLEITVILTNHIVRNISISKYLLKQFIFRHTGVGTRHRLSEHSGHHKSTIDFS